MVCGLWLFLIYFLLLTRPRRDTHLSQRRLFPSEEELTVNLENEHGCSHFPYSFLADTLHGGRHRSPRLLGNETEKVLERSAKSPGSHNSLAPVDWLNFNWMVGHWEGGDKNKVES